MKKPSIAPLALEITGVVTPKSCSFFITELIKYIIYCKQQIPFPFERLKMYVLKRRERLKLIHMPDSEQAGTTMRNRDQLIMEKFFKKVEEAFEILEETFKCIEQKLVESSEHPLSEIVVLFGATPVTPKEMYRISIPPLTYNHSDSQSCWKKQIANVFRQIIISEELHNNIQCRVGLTNMFILFKVKSEVSSKWVLPKDGFSLSSRARQVCFSFTFEPEEKTCVSDNGAIDLNRLSEDMTNLKMSGAHGLYDCEAEVETCKWFQNEKLFKGFKDCKRQGKSVSDLWYKHRFI